MKLLKDYDLIKTASHGSYIKINNTHLDYCCKLGNYLFNTKYAKKSIKYNNEVKKSKLKQSKQKKCKKGKKLTSEKEKM